MAAVQRAYIDRLVRRGQWFDQLGRRALLRCRLLLSRLLLHLGAAHDVAIRLVCFRLARLRNDRPDCIGLFSRFVHLTLFRILDVLLSRLELGEVSVERGWAHLAPFRVELRHSLVLEILALVTRLSDLLLKQQLALVVLVAFRAVSHAGRSSCSVLVDHVVSCRVVLDSNVRCI